LEEPYKAIALRLIENIDDLGYLIAYEKVKAEIEKKFRVEGPEIDKILKIRLLHSARA